MRDKNRNTAISWACQSGYFSIARKLTLYSLGNDADTPLRKATRLHYEELIPEILEHMADPSTLDAQDELGNTALLLAANQGHYNTVLILLAHGADVEIQNKKGETAFVVAAKRGYKNLVTLFLSKGATILPRTFSLVQKHKKIEHLILRYQTIGLELENGETRLMTAINSGYLDLTQLWIAKASDSESTDYDNKTALQRTSSMWFRNKEMAMLIKAGAKIPANSQEAKYLQSRMIPLLQLCLHEGDMPAALNVLNTNGTEIRK